MPRRKRLRKVVSPPDFKSFSPIGAKSAKEAVDLLYEEYEALKLADYRMMNHQEAAVLMGISRPTFARIYETARRKIALALVESREIRSVYGNAVFDKHWYECTSCLAKFSKAKTTMQDNCPICRSDEIKLINK